MKHLSLFILLLLSQAMHSQCCDFDVEYILQAQEVPSQAKLDDCFEKNSCDPRYYHAGKMILAMFDSDMKVVTDNFKKLVNIFENKQTTSYLDLKIIYIYADYLELRGKGIQALAYYKFIKNNASRSSALGTLSTISMHGINGSSNKVLESIETLDLLSNSSLSAAEKLVIVQKASDYLTPKPTYNLFKKYKDLYNACDNNALVFSYLTKILFRFAHDLDPESEKINQKIEELDFTPSTSTLTTSYGIAYSRMLMSKENYDESLTQAKKVAEKKVGKFNSNEELLQIIEKLKETPYDVLGNYAYMTLFQTRLGRGLTPVKDAFNIYESIYHKRLKERTKLLTTITPDRDVRVTNTPNDILVVGIYLYQKTQDIEYLNRAYSVTSGMSSGGVSYWSQARKLMRKNSSFRKAIIKEQQLVTRLRKMDDENTLKEISDLQFVLEDSREGIENKYKSFYEGITDSYSMNLESLQEQMKSDTSAYISFFLERQLLYRLYVSPDTIDITSIGIKSRVQSLNLTERLATMVKSGKSAQEMEPVSRELYSHLFEGIADDLPPQLHIVTNGKLLDVPFSILRKDTTGTTPSYLGVEHAISRQFSLSTIDLLEETTLNPEYAQPLAMAPSFTNELLQASELRQAGFQLPPLVYNTEELHDLEARGGGEYLYNDDATIARYRDRASDYGIIHLATHAISSEVDGLRSRVYLLDDDGEPVGLYAGDIGEQTLNSELVVLSACETGGGGNHFLEGRVGLTKAYLAAGARSVVASNWAVDDHATAEQMKTFYDGIEAGQPPHVALQGARRAYLAAHPDAAPYKWAAFEAYGGMRPVRWDKDSGAGNWWWLALPVLGAGAMFAWNKRQRVRRAA